MPPTSLFTQHNPLTGTAQALQASSSSAKNLLLRTFKLSLLHRSATTTAKNYCSPSLQITAIQAYSCLTLRTQSLEPKHTKVPDGKGGLPQKARGPLSAAWSVLKRLLTLPDTILAEMIAHETLAILLHICFRNDKVSRFPQIFFHVRFQKIVGIAQTTAASHTCDKTRDPRICFRIHLRKIQLDPNPHLKICISFGCKHSRYDDTPAESSGAMP